MKRRLYTRRREGTRRKAERRFEIAQRAAHARAVTRALEPLALSIASHRFTVILTPLGKRCVEHGGKLLPLARLVFRLARQGLTPTHPTTWQFTNDARVCRRGETPRFFAG